MRNPLDESWAKLIRAREHTDSFEAELGLWLQEREATDDVIRTRFEYDPKTGWCEGFIDNIPQPPPYRFGLIIGDIVHNLRSALDHLAWELANLTSPNRGNDWVTQFPITLSPDEFATRGVARLKFIAPEHRGLIEQEQPYITSGSSPEGHPLAWLQDLSNRDKHKGIHPVSVSLDAYYAHPIPVRDADISDRTTYVTDLTVGAKIMRMKLVARGPNPLVEVKPAISLPDVAIRSGNSLGRSDIVLPNLRNHVAGLVGRFSSVFG